VSVARIAREPLLHFVLLGVALFALHRSVAPPAPTHEVVVTTAMRRAFQQEHLRRHGRLPTTEEERALVERYVDTEVMLREALALGSLMNTRGLMELIVLNLGLDLGILSPRIFAMLVLMALATTAMTGPMLTLLGVGKETKRAAAKAGSLTSA